MSYIHIMQKLQTGKHRFDDWEKFEKWMISADSGRTAAKSAKQHSFQAKTVLCAIDKGQFISSLWNKSLLITFLQSYAPERKMLPGTIKSYLSSVRHFMAIVFQKIGLVWLMKTSKIFSL